jgi:chemotaxis signal transduction protein
MLLLTFKVGPESVGLDIRRVREVIPWVALQPLNGQPAWLAGSFVYHGRIVPVIDLFRLTGRGDCPIHLSSRIILLPLEGDGLFGILAAQVAELRDVPETLAVPAAAGNEVNLGTAVADGAAILRLLDPDHLLDVEGRTRLALAAGVAG